MTIVTAADGKAIFENLLNLEDHPGHAVNTTAADRDPT